MCRSSGNKSSKGQNRLESGWIIIGGQRKVNRLSVGIDRRISINNVSWNGVCLNADGCIKRCIMRSIKMKYLRVIGNGGPIEKGRMMDRKERIRNLEKVFIYVLEALGVLVIILFVLGAIGIGHSSYMGWYEKIPDIEIVNNSSPKAIWDLLIRNAEKLS
jgi:hypothetical protein